MHALIVLMLSIAIESLSNTAAAVDKAFTGTFEGTSRACSGALYVRAKTIFHYRGRTCQRLQLACEWLSVFGRVSEEVFA